MINRSISEIWDKIIETEQDFFNRLRELADRSTIEDCSFGVQGSFKSLNID
jgi:methenyltetrahydromethanopterin cyclohydrolase